jgi:hypothetical protein
LFYDVSYDRSSVRLFNSLTAPGSIGALRMLGANAELVRAAMRASSSNRTTKTASPVAASVVWVASGSNARCAKAVAIIATVGTPNSIITTRESRERCTPTSTTEPNGNARPAYSIQSS